MGRWRRRGEGCDSLRYQLNQFIFPRPGYSNGGDIVLCMSQLNLSARAYHHRRSVKPARTIVDLAGRGAARSPALPGTPAPGDMVEIEIRS